MKGLQWVCVGRIAGEGDSSEDGFHLVRLTRLSPLVKRSFLTQTLHDKLLIVLQMSLGLILLLHCILMTNSIVSMMMGCLKMGLISRPD